MELIDYWTVMKRLQFCAQLDQCYNLRHFTSLLRDIYSGFRAREYKFVEVFVDRDKYDPLLYSVKWYQIFRALVSFWSLNLIPIYLHVQYKIVNISTQSLYQYSQLSTLYIKWLVRSGKKFYNWFSFFSHISSMEV